MKKKKAIPFIHWCYRYRLRLRVLSVLLAVLFLVSILDSLSQALFFKRNALQDGALRITPEHFQAPSSHLISWEQWHRFLENVTRGKPGILGQEWFYFTLIALYTALVVIVFLRLTPPDTSDQNQAEISNPENSEPA